MANERASPDFKDVSTGIHHGKDDLETIKVEALRRARLN